MLGFCPTTRSVQFQMSANLRLGDCHPPVFIGGRPNLFRMIFLHGHRTELLWNDIVVKKKGGGGIESLKRYFKNLPTAGFTERTPRDRPADRAETADKNY